MTDQTKTLTLPERRVRLARVMLRCYINAEAMTDAHLEQVSKFHGPITQEEAIESLPDVICDLLHLADSLEMEPADSLRIAMENFEAEME